MSKIKTCRLCKGKKFRKVLDLGKLYLSRFVPQEKQVRMKKYPLKLVVCTECRLVQLENTVEPRLLYTNNYGYRSGVNKTMRNELKNIVNEITRFLKIKKGDTVIDIGSNDGTLLKFYKKGIKKVGYDYVGKFRKYYDGPDEVFVNRPFGKNKFHAKAITAIGMFYDLNNPNLFLKHIRNSLEKDGIFVIQQNYFWGMVNDCAFDNVVHEHLTYFSLETLEDLLKRNGMEVFSVSVNDTNGGSFRTFIQLKGGPRSVKRNVSEMRKKESGYKIDGFEKKINKVSKKLRDYIINQKAKGKQIFLYGASTRGNTLLQYSGLSRDLISYGVERNPEKFGKKIASTNIPIISEEEARKLKPDYLLVLPWYFKEEILKREIKYMKAGGRLIFPLPKLEVYPK